jgi:tetratricopeptide (TPR) repeat protein
MAPRREPRWREPFQRALAAYGESRFAEAVDALNSALRLSPRNVMIHQQLGVVLHKQDRPAAALASFRRAVEIQPDSIIQICNVGIALRDLGRFDEAAQQFEQACRLNPDNAKNHFRWGLALMKGMRPAEAITLFQRALKLEPGHAEAALSLALCYLAIGDFEQGWNAYEARFLHKDSISDPFPEKRWKGELIEGTLVVGAEQGIGDMIQFIRFAQESGRRCGKLVVQAPDELAPLIRRVAGVGTVVRRNTAPREFEAFIPVLSLPAALGIGVNDLASDVPYIVVSHEETEAAETLLRPLVNLFKIGVVWAGNAKHVDDSSRSMPFTALLELLAVPKIALVSLQKGPRSGDLQASGVGAMVSDLSASLNTFASTAALIEQLDLVITCDTSVAHLAGAMGKPVWILLAFSADWRWMVGREDSPWYPSARLFRQKRPGDWTGVMQRVVAALKEIR